MKKENYKVIKKLGNQKLKTPKGLKKFIFHSTDYKTSTKTKDRYINTIEMWNDRLLMRTFAYKPPKKLNQRSYANIKTQEVCRRLEGIRQPIVCQIESNFSGRSVYYTSDGLWVTENNERYYSWYAGHSKSWYFDDYDMFNTDNWIERLNIPYCAYNNENNKTNLCFFDYVCAYRKNPKIELLVKADWSHLVTYADRLNFDGKSFEEIFGIPKKWKRYMRGLYPKQIKIIKKHNPSDVKELELLSSLCNFKMKYITKYLTKRTYAYLSQFCKDGIEKSVVSDYNDYLKYAERIGCEMAFNKILYPVDLKKAHDEFMEKAEIVKTQKYDTRIKKVAEKLKKYIFCKDGLIIVPAQNNEELINESLKLKHCVRDYASRIANGKSKIMFIRSEKNINEPFVTLEFKGKEVIQVRAYDNETPSEYVIDFVRDWENEHHLIGY